MKYDSIRKIPLVKQPELIEYCIAHPELSYEEIGKMWGVSRSEVSLLCNKRGIRRRNRKGG